MWKIPLAVCRRFMADESGLSAVEYGLLAAGIAVGLYTIISGIGGSLRDIFTSVGNDVALGVPTT
jgi:pilus assembly protein Flp/PilA